MGFCRTASLRLFLGMPQPGQKFMWNNTRFADLLKRIQTCPNYFPPLPIRAVPMEEGKLTRLAHTVPNFNKPEKHCQNDYNPNLGGQFPDGRWGMGTKQLDTPFRGLRRAQQNLSFSAQLDGAMRVKGYNSGQMSLKTLAVFQAHGLSN